MNTVTQEIEPKTNKWDLMSYKCFYTTNEAGNGMKRKSTKWKKNVPAVHVADEVRICKELKKP